IDVPTLIISGERDRFTPSWLSDRMAQSVPRAQFMIVPQASHTAPIEEPELIWREVEQFLRDGSKPAPTSLHAKRYATWRSSPTWITGSRPWWTSCCARRVSFAATKRWSTG